MANTQRKTRHGNETTRRPGKHAQSGHRPGPRNESRRGTCGVDTRAVSPASRRNPTRSRRRTSRVGPTENDQKGGDRSDRAAHSGATGERSTSGGQNKPEPKDQDEKGMGHRRNR